jgi:two-component system phosphate regulon response regulator OmpR
MTRSVSVLIVDDAPCVRSIDIRIGRLRRKVEPEPDGEPRCIPIVRNVGYVFVPAN